MLLLLSGVACNASWLFFHKPEFKGKIVDIETNKPIEGAVVVAIYRKQVIGVGDSVIMDFYAREALTDKDGNFKIPSYTSMIQPLSWSQPVLFTIFKSGYASLANAAFEDDFSGIGKNDYEFPTPWNSGSKYQTLKNGVVKLPKVSGKDRIESFYHTGSEISSYKKDLQKANDILNKEADIIIKLERHWRNIK